jgi:hypothetical protein
MKTRHKKYESMHRNDSERSAKTRRKKHESKPKEEAQTGRSISTDVWEQSAK